MRSICVLYEPFLQESQIIVCPGDGSVIPYYGLSTEEDLVKKIQELIVKYKISDIQISAPAFMFKAISENLMTEYSNIKISELEK